MRRRPPQVDTPPDGPPAKLWRFHTPQWWGPDDPGPPPYWGNGPEDARLWPAIRGRRRWQAARDEWAREQGTTSWWHWRAQQPDAEQQRYGH